MNRFPLTIKFIGDYFSGLTLVAKQATLLSADINLGSLKIDNLEETLSPLFSPGNVLQELVLRNLQSIDERCLADIAYATPRIRRLTLWLGRGREDGPRGARLKESLYHGVSTFIRRHRSKTLPLTACKPAAGFREPLERCPAAAAGPRISQCTRTPAAGRGYPAVRLNAAVRVAA